MTDRIDQYLEGTIGRDALSPAERDEADAAARAVTQTRAFLAARATPDMTDAVMRRLAQPAPAGSPVRLSLVGGFLRNLWAPRQVSVRPAYAVLAAAASIAALLVVAPDIFRAKADGPQTAAGDLRLFVQFRLQADASTVKLAGSFTNWEPAYELQQIAPGMWTVTVPLSQGVHDYAFVVDGQRWIADPYAPRINDGFGGTNSRLTLLLPEPRRI